MTEFINNFHFLRPWFLLFLLLPLFFYLRNFNLVKNDSSWENVCDNNLLKFLLVQKGTVKKISIKKYIYCGLVAAIIAAAGPSWKKIDIPALMTENPSLFVLSLSQDMQLQDITPSRLERAKYVISDITDNIEDGQFGLEVYSQEPYIITPLTDDTKLIKNLLPQIVPNIVPDNGDRLDRAIDLAFDRFQSAGYTNGNIILFASDVGQQFDLAIQKTKEAKQKNYMVHVIDTSFSGNEKLKLLAEKGSGLYLSIKDFDLPLLLSKLQQHKNEKMKNSENLRSIYFDYGYYLVFISLFCLMPFFRRGFLILFLCLYSFQVQASFFLNDNQEGFRFFNNNQYDLALDKFKDAVWRGVTLYKQDKKEEALQEFSKSNSENALYNSGVVHAKMCHYEDALQFFEKVLKINPKNEDALYNRDILKDLFAKAKDDPSVLSCDNKQQQNQNDEQNNDDNQNNNKNDEQQNQDQDQQNQNSSNDNSSDNNQQEQQNKEQNEDSSNSNQKQEASKQDNKENSNDKEQQKDNSSQASDDNNSSQKENRNDEKDKATNDDGPENNSQNQKGDNNNGKEPQKQEAEVQNINAKEGDENTKYDEEALAMQRQYREIPEDVGGLLREFIKKEYLKGRYDNEI